MIISILFLLISRQSKRRRPNLPPSPPSLPFIGHLHLLKLPLHRTLQTLSTNHGPIFSLALGARNVVVVSSPALAEECLQQNGVVFANRPHSFLGFKIFAYNYTSIGAAPYGPHWRNLRRLSAVELLSAARLNSFLHMIAGKRYFGGATEGRGEEGEEFKELMREVFELSATSNPVDFLPVLKWVDFSGLEKRMWRAHQRMDRFFQSLIDEHRSKMQEEEEDGVGSSRKTMIDTMLILQGSEPETYSDDIIKGHVMSLILAGTDTTAATIEWGMSLLLNHPEILDKARAEIDNAVGNSRLVQESDCIDLPYLQCIIKETFRLYPVGPLLIPHQSSEDCTVGGYFVSKETMLFVNTWAIHRDPTVWEDPTRFWPERHSEAEGNPYRLLPFGAGRRSCPGIALANRAVSVALGTLIQCFEWKRAGEEILDMTEGPGLSMPKLVPLEALCKPRKFMEDVLINMQGDK
ncbi:unnamed protein product [Linum tenue]|uniref:Cytochrome P450 n=1 Tax=Linum tenue TaxID=586396 RepID=A0AAV0KTH3_9ROSI|nr:unnamed protein product [Linum tenue]